MNFVTFLKQTRLIGATALAFCSVSHAFDLSLLHNDKEARSHAFNGLEKNTALRKASGNSNQAYSLLGESFNEMEKSHGYCDLPLYQSFIGKLKTANIPNSTKDVVNLLIVWRSQDLIDDLFFEIMEQTSNLYGSIDSTPIEKIGNREIKKAGKILSTQDISTQDLMAFYESFNGTSLENPGCTVFGWSRTSKQLASVSKDKNAVRLMNVIARDKSIISEDVFKLVEFYRVNEVQNWDLTLSKYLDIVKNAKNTARSKAPKDSDLKTNTLSSRYKDKKTFLTYRQNLYYHFNSTQINMLSDLLKSTFDRMDATKTEVVFTFKDGSETFPVSPMGQYFLARKLLLKDMGELSRSSIFGGAPVAHEDLVAAALETGLINSDVLESVLKIDDLWNPEVKPWQKVANYAMQVTGTATIFLPPPYNIISSIALVFIDGFIRKKTTKTSQSDNSYDFF